MKTKRRREQNKLEQDDGKRNLCVCVWVELQLTIETDCRPSFQVNDFQVAQYERIECTEVVKDVH